MAYAFFEPQEPLIPFIPSWYNVWESHMLRLAGKKRRKKLEFSTLWGQS
ncbi:hypothetical protein IC611_00315 [Proteus mirabilis]